MAWESKIDGTKKFDKNIEIIRFGDANNVQQLAVPESEMRPLGYVKKRIKLTILRTSCFYHPFSWEHSFSWPFLQAIDKTFLAFTSFIEIEDNQQRMLRQHA